MATCPICNTTTDKLINGSPYWDCPNCQLWYQQPLPSKVFEGVHEKDETGHSARMGDQEKEINRYLANNIFVTNMGSKPGKCLDVGSKYPYLSKCLIDMGCTAYGMDAIDEVQEYSNELNVPMIWGDFENLSVEEILAQTTGGEKFNLITLVHMFEHLYNPLEGLKKLKALLADDGVLFLRLPSHGVSGYNHDMNPFHYKIHPYFHSMISILELLVQGKDLFMIEAHTPMEGAGQVDIILRPLQKKPHIWAGMIVKNEERDLPKCLATIQDCVDGLVIMDTGSTDKTEEFTKAMWTKPLIYETYTGASKQDANGDWKLWNFSKARNQFVERIEAMPEADFLIWFDADDTLLTPNQLKRMFYSPYKIFGVMIETDGLTWVHHRAWRTKIGITFDGRIHEYPVLGNHDTFVFNNVVVHHDAAPGIGEDSNARNLRILEAELAENPQDARTAFYLANTHKDAGRYLEAVKYYDIRIKIGMSYFDEWITAYLYKGRCERAAGLIKEAEQTLLEGLSHAQSWSELWMELGYIYYNINKHLCISYCLQAANRPNTTTQLCRENNKYEDQPRRMLSFCYQDLGDTTTALKWAEEAKRFIGVDDMEWDCRILALKTTLNGDTQQEIKKAAKKKIAMHRPGAIGDIIMTLNLVPKLKEQFPDYEIDYFCDPGIGNSLEPLFKLAGISKWYNFEELSIVEFDYEHVFNMVGYPIPPKGNYPEEPMNDHLLNYFAAEVGLGRQAELPQLALQKPEPLVEGSYITIHPKAGWSMYKNWTQQKWEELIVRIQEESSVPVKFIQIGAISDFKINGCDHSFMGNALMDSVSLIANAEMHMGVDSFSNHLTHIKWNGKRTKGVILWGSTQASAAGYEENINISLGLPCQPCFREDPRISRQPRGLCINPEGQDSYNDPQHACMSGISVDLVLNTIKEALALN
ncbi:MAG: methyltransferase domain-containing protein [Ignisphaera sp.]|nr:methyltransferase domain-containing protein [Ignisphaera sp.]